VDPVEKKPLFHFIPGSRAFSVATAGCNLHCLNCQNWEISQAAPDSISAYKVPPSKLVGFAKRYKCKSIAYTYTDPVIFYEYALDSSRKAHAEGIKNILVTAGYINRKPLLELCKVTDAANIDLKAFSDSFYRKICGATLKPVLDTLVTAKNAGVMVEVTNLLLPTLNDSDEMIKKLCRWVKSDMGAETPLHFSKFFPRYRMRNLPETSQHTMEKARQIALAEGLKFVYVGNLLNTQWSSTNCPGCSKLLVKRSGYRILENNLKNGKCPKCGTKIYGVWK
jgi:pyruvate formate lyase activating enzyme